MSFIAEEVAFIPLCPQLAALDDLPTMFELVQGVNTMLKDVGTPQGVKLTVEGLTAAVKAVNLTTYTTKPAGKQALEQKIKPAAEAYLQSLFRDKATVSIYSPTAAYIPSTTSNRHEIVGRIRLTRGESPTTSLILDGLRYQSVDYRVEVLVRLSVRWCE